MTPCREVYKRLVTLGNQTRTGEPLETDVILKHERALVGTVPLLTVVLPLQPEESPSKVSTPLEAGLIVSAPCPLRSPPKVLRPPAKAGVLALTMSRGLEKFTESWLNRSVLAPSEMEPVPSMPVSVTATRAL